MRVLVAAFLLAAPLAAQRDFLTADEADQVRLAQEPDARIKLYLQFARQRADLIDQLFAQNKIGRSAVLHDTLEQLGDIIDTIDTVVDDALQRHKEITVMKDVAEVEKQLLARLQKHAEANPPDMERYRFALDTAIDTLKDSSEMAEEDLRTRTHEVEARTVEERKERQTMMTPESKAEVNKTDEKKAADAAAQKKKPTLLRKGETPPGKAPGKQ
jgi:hypothetical protein